MFKLERVRQFSPSWAESFYQTGRNIGDPRVANTGSGLQCACYSRCLCGNNSRTWIPLCQQQHAFFLWTAAGVFELLQRPLSVFCCCLRRLAVFPAPPVSIPPPCWLISVRVLAAGTAAHPSGTTVKTVCRAFLRLVDCANNITYIRKLSTKCPCKALYPPYSLCQSVRKYLPATVSGLCPILISNAEIWLYHEMLILTGTVQP